MKTIPRIVLGTALCGLITLVHPALGAPAQSGRPQKLASPGAVPEGLSAPDWSSIRQQYEQHRHAAVPVAGGHRARNPGQHWQTQFDGRGFITKPDAAGWQWGLELKSYGFAGRERAVTSQPRVSIAGQRVTYDWDDTLQEWFVNDARGLEHGFTVRERPCFREPRSSRHEAQYFPFNDQSLLTSAATAEELTPLTFTLTVRGGLRPEVQADGRSVHFVDNYGTTALTYAGLTAFDADGRRLSAHFEPVERSRRSKKEADSDAQKIGPVRLVIDERGARYPLTIDPIAQQAFLKTSNTGADDHFGGPVAVSGDTVVVGALFEDSNATGVNGDENDNSAPESGAAYVFVRNGTTWSQQAYLKASNTEANDWFGRSVAVSGDTVVVGAIREASNATGVNGDESDNSAFNSGAAYVFVRNGTTWSQQAYLKASNTEGSIAAGIPGDTFGLSVAVSGDTVVVGASWEDSSATGVNGDENDNSAPESGAAYVFVRNGTTWSQQAYLKASNTGANDFFGDWVAVSGDTVVVRATREDSSATGVNGDENDNSAPESGATYVFVRSGTNWSQHAYLKASNTGAGDGFGGVAISGDTVVVGAIGEDSNATGVNGDENDNSAPESGAAYVFVRNGTTWSQQAYLKASNTGAEDQFGLSVAVSGDTVVVSADYEDSNVTGVNGNQSNNCGTNSGAAYVFVRNGTTWSQQAYLKASNTGASDGFGGVAISGDTVVVGANVEDSSATGVNGDESDNSAPDSGAAYIFTGLSLVNRLAIEPDGNRGYFIRFAGHAGFSYALQRAANVSGPWPTLATNTAPASGLVEFHDPNPLPGAAFYRTVQP